MIFTKLQCFLIFFIILGSHVELQLLVFKSSPLDFLLVQFVLKDVSIGFNETSLIEIFVVYIESLSQVIVTALVLVSFTFGLLLCTTSAFS